MSTIKYGNKVEVAGIKPVADGVVYHTRYQAHNLVTDEIKEHADLATLVEATLVWVEQPSNAITWYEVIYKGNKNVFTPDDVMYSGFVENTMRRMVYSLRDTLRFNQSLLNTDALITEVPNLASNVTFTVVIEVEGNLQETGIADEWKLLRDAMNNEHHIHSVKVDNIDVKEVF